MTTDEIAPVSQPMLSNLAKCQQCASPLAVAVGSGQPPRYACTGNACGTPEIDVRHLDELIINRVVANVFTADMLEAVGTMVRNNARQQASQEQRRLELLHDELEHLDVEATSAVNAEDLAQLAQERRTVQDEAQQAEHALQGLRHVASNGNERIVAYASNPETYLRETNAAAAKSILELTVREVLVSTDAVTVAYSADALLKKHAAEIRSSEELAAELAADNDRLIAKVKANTPAAPPIRVE